MIDFANLRPGDELPPLSVTPSYMDLVVYAGTSRDYFDIHHDRDAARAAGHPDVIVQGSLKAGWLARLVTGPLADRGRLRRFAVQYRGIDTPGRTLVGHGVVRARHEHPAEIVLEFDLWLENGAGVRSIVGAAVVAVPRLRPDGASTDDARERRPSPAARRPVTEEESA